MSEQGLTLTRQRVAEVLASGKARTITEAAEIADVARETVHRLSRNATVQREIERLRAKAADKAKDLKAISASKLAVRVASDDASDALLLGTYKTANDVLASGVEEDTSTDPHARARGYAQRIRDFEAGIKWEQRRLRRMTIDASPQR